MQLSRGFAAIVNFSPPSGARRHGGGRAAGCGRLVMELELIASHWQLSKIDGNIMSTIPWRRVLKSYFLEVELQAMNPLRRRGGCVLPRRYEFFTFSGS